MSPNTGVLVINSLMVLAWSSLLALVVSLIYIGVLVIKGAELRVFDFMPLMLGINSLMSYLCVKELKK